MGDRSNAGHWFEIAVTDLERAKTFYEKVLDTSLNPLEAGPVRMAWFPQQPGSPGSAGGLIQAEGRTPSRDGTLVYLTVPDVDATLSKITASGGKVVLPKTLFDQGGSLTSRTRRATTWLSSRRTTEETSTASQTNSSTI